MMTMQMKQSRRKARTLIARAEPRNVATSRTTTRGVSQTTVFALGMFAVVFVLSVIFGGSGTGSSRGQGTSRHTTNMNSFGRQARSLTSFLAARGGVSSSSKAAAAGESGDTGTATESSEYHPIVRYGECDKAPYGNFTKEDYYALNKGQELEDLSLTELLIHLDHPTYVSPPNILVDSPVIVDIGLYVLGITDLDAGSNSFVLEGYLDMVWCDPRTKFSKGRSMNDPNRRQHIFLEQDAAKEIEHIWWPALTFVNELHPRETENQELLLDNDGTVEYKEKFVVQLATNYDMHRFPFDAQTLVAEIESFAWNSDVLQFAIEEDLVGFSDKLEIPEHYLTGIDEHLEIRHEPRDRHAFSELMTEIYVQRNPTYYLTKVIIPLSLIVVISWAVFWMDCDALADRMGVSFTGVLTSVAYQFVVSDCLPRHIYNTFLDNFVLLTFVLMVLTVVINIATHNLYNKGYVWHARTVDKICRVFFPSSFLISVGILAGAQIVTDYLPTGGIVGICMSLVFLLFVFLGYLVYVRHYGRMDIEEKMDAEGNNNYNDDDDLENYEVDVDFNGVTVEKKHGNYGGLHRKDSIDSKVVTAILDEESFSKNDEDGNIGEHVGAMRNRSGKRPHVVIWT